MAIVMHDLAGQNPDLRFSPYCWRTRLALAHKGLEVETVPWRFTHRDALAFSGQAKVPVNRDRDAVVSDSWAIAGALEREIEVIGVIGNIESERNSKITGGIDVCCYCSVRGKCC